MNLNENAWQCCDAIAQRAEQLSVVVRQDDGGPRIIDCGVEAAGGLEAGRALAEVCLAGLGSVSFTDSDEAWWPGQLVRIETDQPLAACMASQYAGWPIAGKKYFAMGSGPMRAARGREELFDKIGHLESPDKVVGVLESGKLPPQEICDSVAKDCGVEIQNVTLLVARTASLAGTVQIVARSVETTMHKLFELGFDLTRIESGFGTAPLPPVADDDMAAIGRTNDAVLYGGETTLRIRCDDAELEAIGPKIPSSASPDFGQPFAEIFKRYDCDFYKIDPLLFSPAVVNLVSVESGRTFRFGELRGDVLRQSFS